MYPQLYDTKDFVCFYKFPLLHLQKGLEYFLLFSNDNNDPLLDYYSTDEAKLGKQISEFLNHLDEEERNLESGKKNSN
ncbi:hypothetical protein CUU64_20470 [Bacillus sp. V5-8f]|nr:hypothetical protein CUU64_20470 [Bacillus sp. V5-8f]